MKQAYLKPTTAVFKIVALPIMTSGYDIPMSNSATIMSNSGLGGNDFNRSKDNVWDDDEEDW